MTLYTELNEIFPYLVSIRKLETYISIDVEIPTSWRLPKKYVDEKMVLEHPDSLYFTESRTHYRTLRGDSTI
jgi:hypothetical protein